MENSAVSSAREKYDTMFDTEKSKADAFDKLAEKYYYANFGMTSKSDIDTLMFSIYIEQILVKSEEDMRTYSDYELSKSLGITQSRISNLKVKKQLQYPYDNFNWKTSFERIVEKYRYEDGKIILFIPDKNLYNEIKNAIENAGGYVEVQLNTKLLKITPEYFVDLIVITRDEKDRKKIKCELKAKLSEHSVSVADFDKKSFGELLKGSLSESVGDIVAEMIGVCVPFVGPILREPIGRLMSEIRSKKRGITGSDPGKKDVAH